MTSGVKAIEESDLEDIEETYWERFVGLSEMFPDSVKHGTVFAVGGLLSGIKTGYWVGRQCAWVFFSSATILMVPVMFEVERCQMEQQQLAQQRQILLGPGAAVAGGQHPMMQQRG